MLSRQGLRPYGRTVVVAVGFWLASLALFMVVSAFARLGLGVQEDTVCRLDCQWYQSIVMQGYDVEPHGHAKGDAANWAFFPLHPLAARGLGWLTGLAPDSALVWTSRVFLLLGIAAFAVAAQRRFGREAVVPAAALVAFHPYLIYAHAGYTEALYFFLSTVGFMAASYGRWLTAGVAGALLSATRLVGVVFGAVLAWALWCHKVWRSPQEAWRGILALALVPLGLASFMAYLSWRTGDALAFMHVMVAWGREPSNPVSWLWQGLSGQGWGQFFALAAVLGLAMSVWLWRRGWVAEGFFLAVVTLVPLATGLDSLPRYVSWQFPFLWGALELLRRWSALSLPVMAFSGAGAACIVLAWFFGKGFVI